MSKKQPKEFEVTVACGEKGVVKEGDGTVEIKNGDCDHCQVFLVEGQETPTVYPRFAPQHCLFKEGQPLEGLVIRKKS